MGLLTKTKNAWLDAVREAVAVETELREIQRADYYKLAPTAFVGMSIRLAHSTPDRIATLRAKVERESATVPHAAAYVRRAVDFIRSPRTTRPPKDIRGYAFLTDPNDSASAEAAMLGATGLAELYAVGATIAAERPEAFGRNEDWDAWEARCAQLKERRTELIQRVNRTWTMEDLTVGAPLRFGDRALYPLSFKIAGGEVEVTPDAGEQLIHWLLNHPEVVRELDDPAKAVREADRLAAAARERAEKAAAKDEEDREKREKRIPVPDASADSPYLT